MKFVDYNLLLTPHKEGMDLSDEFLLTNCGLLCVCSFGLEGGSEVNILVLPDTISVGVTRRIVFVCMTPSLGVTSQILLSNPILSAKRKIESLR